MGNNANFWKNAYKDTWEVSNKKEDDLRKIIESHTGLTMIPYGLGACETTFISGSAASNGNTKGSPDFRIKDTNIFVEVTGPLSKFAKPKSGLWIRPDKLEYAYRRHKKADEFIAAYFPSTNEWCIIHATAAFFKDVHEKGSKKTDYRKITPKIRGNVETYIEIKYDNPFVKDLDYMLNYLSRTKARKAG